MFRLHRVSKIHSVEEQPLKNWWKSRASILLHLFIRPTVSSNLNKRILAAPTISYSPPSPPTPTPSFLLLFPCTERMNRDGRGWNKSTGGKWRIGWGEQLIESKDRLASPSPEIPIQSNEKEKAKLSCWFTPKGRAAKKKVARRHWVVKKTLIEQTPRTYISICMQGRWFCLLESSRGERQSLNEDG